AGAGRPQRRPVIVPLQECMNSLGEGRDPGVRRGDAETACPVSDREMLRPTLRPTLAEAACAADAAANRRHCDQPHADQGEGELVGRIEKIDKDRDTRGCAQRADQDIDCYEQGFHDFPQVLI
ncbi:MAG: hypothetical protein Q8J67_08050, partial [Rhodocyclaceae bacterium]|nr:hypothetical protein [Rhodocyclaceae bacterium]